MTLRQISRAIMSFAALVLLVSPSAAHGGTCKSAQAKITAMCCSARPPHTSTKTVSVPTTCDCNTPDPVSGKVTCTPSGFISQPCIPEAELVKNGAVSKGSPTNVTKESESRAPAGMTAACSSALHSAKASCAEADVHVDCPEHGSATVLPVCEGLAVVTGSFRCSPSTQRIDPVPPEMEVIVKEKFTSDPTTTSWHDDPDHAPPGTSVTIPNEFANPSVGKQEVTDLRLEVPGNFVRFQLVSAALRSAIQDKLSMLPGFSCDADKLACDVNVLAAFDLTDSITKALASMNITAAVAQNSDGYKLTDFYWESLHDYLEIRAQFTGNVQVSQDRGLSFALRDDGHMALSPLHDPKAENGYTTALNAVDARMSYLDRAVLMTNVSQEDCTYLTGATFREAALHNRYLTFSGPYACRCSGDRSRNYCVTDAYPRKINLVNDRPLLTLVQPGWFPSILLGINPATGKAVGAGAKRAYVYCAGLTADDLRLDVDPIDPLPATTVTKETSLKKWANDVIADASVEKKLFTALLGLTCNGRYAQRLPIGPQSTSNFGHRKIEVGKHVSSAAGASFATSVTLPRIVAHASFGVVIVHFDLGVKAEHFFEKWYLKVLGWIAKLVLRVFSTLATVVSTVAEILLSGDSYVDLGTQELLAQPLISHTTALIPTGPRGPVQARPQIDVGLRRVATNIPDIKVVPLDPSPTWTLSACDFSDKDGWPDWVLGLITCPLETTINIGKLATAPIIAMLKSLGNIIIDVLADVDAQVSSEYLKKVSKLEDSHNLGRLFSTAVQSVSLLPYYLEKDGKAGNAPLEMGYDSSFKLQPADLQAKKVGQDIPPPFNAMCLLSSQANAACLLSRIYLGSGFLAKTSQVEIVRMGAKTHYRSLQDLHPPMTPIIPSDYAAAGLSWDFPPVRYCVGGDTPPGSVAYEGKLFASVASPGKSFLNLTAASPLDQLTDLGEIDTSPAGDPIPRDWRTQCAIFADVRVHTAIRLRGNATTNATSFAELVVKPTKRTNYLINEVFVCEDDAYCTPSFGTQPPLATAPGTTGLSKDIRQRAALAACSLAGDVWYRVCPATHSGCDPTQPYENLLVNVTSTWPVSPVVQWMMTTLATTAGNPAAATAAADTLSFVHGCSDTLTRLGFTVDATRPALSISP